MSVKYLIVSDGSANSTKMVMREDGEEVGDVWVRYEDDALFIDVARIDEAATGPVKLVVH